jgi:hypothetical protein
MLLLNVTFDTDYNDYLLYKNDNCHIKKLLSYLILIQLKQINN